MRALAAIAGLLRGVLIGFSLAFGGYLVWLSWLDGFDREGAAGMAVFFLYGPAIGLVIGIVLATAGWKRFSR